MWLGHAHIHGRMGLSMHLNGRTKQYHTTLNAADHGEAGCPYQDQTCRGCDILVTADI
jgi:hypothetical protein